MERKGKYKDLFPKTREDFIYYHRIMWDEIVEYLKNKKTVLPVIFLNGNVNELKAIVLRKMFGYIPKLECFCFLCEYAKREKEKLDIKNPDSTIETCWFCPLCKDNNTNKSMSECLDGLFMEFNILIKVDSIKPAIKLAKVIANLPEPDDD